MQVRALESFTARYGGQTYHANKGQVIEVPDGLGVQLRSLVQVIEAPENAALHTTSQARKTEAEPVTVVKGVGPVTAEVLAPYGIETVADLAAAEGLPEDLLPLQKAARKYLRQGRKS